MNLFEQYGIKEVADVTLYGITYDKYENEVYIPVMYFDTLKVSSVEQTAEQTTANGGLGNATHVIWDYGKEINITLQDALYTPASQNLLWNGRYGLKPISIKGFWKPAQYQKDESDNYIYYNKEVRTLTEQEGSLGTTIVQIQSPIDTFKEDKYVAIHCPCDNTYKWITYVPAAAPDNTPLEGDVLCRRVDKDTNDNITNTYKNVQISKQEEIKIYSEQKYLINKSKYNEISKAEVLINNFENFDTIRYDIEEQDNAIIVTKNTDGTYREDCHSMLEYTWQNCQAQMITTENDKEQAVDDNVNFSIQSFEDNNNKRYLFKDSNGNFIAYQHFYKTITKELKGFETKIVDNKVIKCRPVIKYIPIKVYLGTFYIVEDWNINNTSEEPGIHLIDTNLKTVSLLDRMENCEAEQTFAIDVDKNIKSYNAMKDPKYSNSELTVYIDPNTLVPYEATNHTYESISGVEVRGNLKVFKQGEVFLKKIRTRATETDQFYQTVVRAQDYPGTFKMVGETYIRNRFGEDERYQIEVPLCKLSSDVTLDLQAESEPCTVDMSLKALRQEDGTMMKLTLYKEQKKKNCPSAITVPVQSTNVVDNYSLNILSPQTNEIYCVQKDCRISDEAYGSINETFLTLPTNESEAKALAAALESDGYDEFIKSHREILLVEILNNGKLKGYLTKDKDNISVTITYGSDN